MKRFFQRMIEAQERRARALLREMIRDGRVTLPEGSTYIG